MERFLKKSDKIDKAIDMFRIDKLVLGEKFPFIRENKNRYISIYSKN